MSANLIEALKISCVVLPILIGLHKVFRILIEKKYPTIVVYQPERGLCRVKIYRLGELGGLRYGTYDFWGSDGTCRLYSGQELLVQIFIPLFVISTLFGVMDEDLHTMKALMTALASVFDLLIFALIFKGRHQAYIALKKYIRKKDTLQETMPEMGVIYDTKPAEDLCMAGLDQEGLLTHFPLLPKEEIWRIYKDSKLKKYDRYQRLKTTSNVILAVIAVVTLITILITKNVLIFGAGMFLVLLEGVIMGLCGLGACPYCGKGFGRSEGGSFCWNCRGPLSKEARKLWLQTNSADTEDQTLQDL